MRITALLSYGLVFVHILACGSGDDGPGQTTPNAGGVGNTAATPSEGGSTADTTASNSGGSTADATAAGGTTATSSGGSSASSSDPSAGGSTSTGGSSSSATAAGGGTDTPLPRSSPYAGKLIINEICPSNRTGATEGGSYPDWVELYNSSSDDISLVGFYITDDNAQLTKYALTKPTLVVKAGGMLLLWADGDDGETDFHLGFSLSAAGETLTLLDSDQQVIDSMSWSNAEIDKAYARLPDGTGDFAWCSAGTPNRANGSACP